MPETLMPLVIELETAWREASTDAGYLEAIDHFSRHYIGRPSPLYFAERMTEHLGGAKIYFKRDELNHTGAHKINNCLGQILLAKRMGKRRIIAETGAGQHGVATASVCARFGLPCVVYMGAKDIERQSPNVYRMRLLGCEVVPCTNGSASLKDAMNEALRDWVSNVEDSYYLIGSVAGPHPYPEMVRDLQAVIGRETRAQLMEAEGRLPDLLVASVGGGSNALGALPSLFGRKQSQHARRRGGGKRHADKPACRNPDARRKGNPARQHELCLARRARADPRGALNIGRARLSRRRSRTRLSQRQRAHRVCRGN